MFGRDTKSWMEFLCRWVAWRTDSCFDIHCSNNSVRIRFLTTDPYRLVQSILYGIVSVQLDPARRKWNNWCGVRHDMAASETKPPRVPRVPSATPCTCVHSFLRELRIMLLSEWLLVSVCLSVHLFIPSLPICSKFKTYNKIWYK